MEQLAFNHSVREANSGPPTDKSTNKRDITYISMKIVLIPTLPSITPITIQFRHKLPAQIAVSLSAEHTPPSLIEDTSWWQL